MQYIALIHKNTDSAPTAAEWSRFFEVAGASGMFRGGSEISKRHVLGKPGVPDTTLHLGGYMRFDTDDLSALRELLDEHPVIAHGGTIELCEMPES